MRQVKAAFTRVSCGVVTLAVLGALSIAAPIARADRPATEYKLHFSGTGSEEVSDTDMTNPQYSEHHTASWTYLPTDVNVWLPRFNGPPGLANAGFTESTTSDTRPFGSNVGEVKESGTYLKDQDNQPTAISYSCSGQIAYLGVYVHRVIVGPLSGKVDIETDFKGVLGIGGGGGFSNVFGPCWNDGSGSQNQDGFFHYAWDDPHGQRLQVGMTIEAQQIGDPTIGGPAQDFNNVATSQSTEACWVVDGTVPCPVKFSLGGEYQLTKICDGRIGAGGVGACGGPPPPSTTPKPPTGPKSHGGGGGGPGAKGKTCTVPKLVGDTLMAARSALSKARCKLGAVAHHRSATVRKGRVISSSPKAGTKRKEGASVKLTVSSGKR